MSNCNNAQPPGFPKARTNGREKSNENGTSPTSTMDVSVPIENEEYLSLMKECMDDFGISDTPKPIEKIEEPKSAQGVSHKKSNPKSNGIESHSEGYVVKKKKPKSENGSLTAPHFANTMEKMDWVAFIDFMENSIVKQSRFVVPKATTRAGHALRTRSKALDIRTITMTVASTQRLIENLHRKNLLDTNRSSDLHTKTDNILASCIGQDQEFLDNVYASLLNMKAALEKLGQ